MKGILRCLVVAAFALVAGCGDGPDTTGAGMLPVRFVVDPQDYKFGPVDVGTVATATITLTNLTNRSARVALGDTTSDVFTFELESMDVLPTEVRNLRVTFEPNGTGAFEHDLDVRLSLTTGEATIAVRIEGRGL